MYYLGTVTSTSATAPSKHQMQHNADPGNNETKVNHTAGLNSYTYPTMVLSNRNSTNCDCDKPVQCPSPGVGGYNDDNQVTAEDDDNDDEEADNTTVGIENLHLNNGSRSHSLESHSRCDRQSETWDDEDMPSINQTNPSVGHMHSYVAPVPHTTSQINSIPQWLRFDGGSSDNDFDDDCYDNRCHNDYQTTLTEPTTTTMSRSRIFPSTTSDNAHHLSTTNSRRRSKYRHRHVRQNILVIICSFITVYLAGFLSGTIVWWSSQPQPPQTQPNGGLNSPPNEQNATPATTTDNSTTAEGNSTTADTIDQTHEDNHTNIFDGIDNDNVGIIVNETSDCSDDNNSNTTSSDQILVGAYYYPWYADDFHRGEGYVRNQLTPPQLPLLGEYDDRDPATISQHLLWSQQANIDLWITSWWGPGSREDQTIRNAILKHPQLLSSSTHKIALFYETTGRIKSSENYTTHRVQTDVGYICEFYFDHPNYLHIDGKPVLFVYLTRKLESQGDLLPIAIDLMRQAAKSSGCGDIYIVGDHVFRGPPSTDDVYPPFSILNGVTNYDIYGSMGGTGGFVGRQGVMNYYEEQRDWRTLALQHGCAFLPSTSPGYNDLGVRPHKNHRPLSRRLSPNHEEGSLFRLAVQQARGLVDHNARNILIVNSFNEFHEDTQIEPVTVSDGLDGITNLPLNLTYNLSYVGYGELYLNILKEQTTYNGCSAGPIV